MRGFRIFVSAFVLTGAVLYLGAGPADAYVINNTMNGGDCTKFGSWDSRTKTCTLTRDIVATESQEPLLVQDDGYVIYAALVRINAAGVTINGNGYALSWPETMSERLPNFGIYSRKNRVTVKNLAIRNNSDLQVFGISAEGRAKSRVRGWRVSGCRFEGCFRGLSLVYVKSFSIRDCSFGSSPLADGRADSPLVAFFASRLKVRGNTFWGGLLLQTTHNSEFSGNAFPGGMMYSYNECNDNLYAENSFVVPEELFNPVLVLEIYGRRNTIRDNTFDYSYLNVSGTGASVVYHNNFISRYYSYGPPRNPYPVPVLIPNVRNSTETPNTFSLPAPVGGNYYNTFDEASEGCMDADADGICDGPVSFGFGSYPWIVDNLPFTTPDGWLQ